METLFDNAVMEYIHSKKFRRLAYNSKRNYMNGIATLEPHFSGKGLDEITRPMVIKFRDHYYDMPGKCKIALATLSNILKYAYDRGNVDRNVAAAVGDLPPDKPIERWDEAEIDRFLDGAPYYLIDAMMVALYTGQRRGDLIWMDWKDYENGTIHVKQRKTNTELWIPVHPKLKERLEAMAKRTPKSTRVVCTRILLNCFGQPWSAESLRCAFKRRCAKVGIEGRTIHGIRKTCASILAEMGCTVHQIMAITGHRTMKEITRYTEEAEKKRMAQEAIDKWQ